MSKLGLIVDSLQIQEIDDAVGYIRNLGRPHAAAISSVARIAEAQRDREAILAEQKAEIKKAAAAAKARQAGPLSEATARQDVVVEETKAAELEASLAEKRLQAEIRKPADAKAYETVTLAEADRQATIAGASAEAEGGRHRRQGRGARAEPGGRCRATARREVGGRRRGRSFGLRQSRPHGGAERR